MSRIYKLENIYKETLEDKDIQNISEFLQSVVDADITKGKYARFLIESFLNDKFLEEDLIGGVDSTVGQAIRLFDKHKSKLPENMRSVYAVNPETGEALYQSPGDLWKAVKQFQDELSGKELKKEEQEKVYRETEFVYKDEETGFQIVSPLTEESAKWWGKGTRWCTSAEKNNMFKEYVKDAPLFILLMPNGDKLQLWIWKDNIQFMDDADNEMELDYIKENWNILEPICLWLNDLKFIPEEYITKELLELAVKQNGLALRYVQEEYRTPDLCEIAIQQDGRLLLYVPKKLRTKELCELAIKENGYALADIPYSLITKELCELAVKQNGLALAHLLGEHRFNEDIYKLAVQQNGRALGYVPEKLITPELCEIAVKQNGTSLGYVPNEIKTKELCEMAVQQNGLSVVYVPENIITEEFYKLAIQQDGAVFEYVPYEYRTPEVCKIVREQNEKKIESIPECENISFEQYQEIFKEMKRFFSKKDISLSYHYS